MNRLRPFYDSGKVARFHTHRTLHKQTIAEHAWGVAAVVLWLYGPGLPSAALLRAALLHDAPELATGDTPAPAKWSSAALTAALDAMEREVWHEAGLPDPSEDLTPAELGILSFADMAELALYCIGEINMGNRTLLPTAHTGVHVMRERLTDWPASIAERAVQLVYSLDQQLKEFK